MSIEELERNLRKWAKKFGKDNYIDFKVISLELTEKEKKDIDQMIEIERILH